MVGVVWLPWNTYGKWLGGESFYGDPLIQKDIALFKKVPEEATFEDLTDQKGPEEDLDEIQVDVEEFVENRQGQHEDPKITPTNVPRSGFKGG